MSRIGRKPVVVPKGVTVTLQGHSVAVKGPRGELRRSLQAEGVDVDAFMKRVSALAPEKREAVRNQAVQTSGTVKEKLKKLVDSIVGVDESLPSGAFARDGRRPSRAPFKDGAKKDE